MTDELCTGKNKWLLTFVEFNFPKYQMKHRGFDLNVYISSTKISLCRRRRVFPWKLMWRRRSHNLSEHRGRVCMCLCYRIFTRQCDTKL